MKPAHAKKINDRMKTAIENASTHGIIARYHIHDDSVQAELRLYASWSIRYRVDEIHYPKNLAREYDHPLWVEMRNIAHQISRASHIVDVHESTRYIPINARTKTGPARRAEAQAQLEIEWGKTFLATLKKTLSKRNLTQIKTKIAGLQTQQKALLPKLRAVNSEYLSLKKAEKAEQAFKNKAALQSGRFWEADRDALRDYFSPPFDKNYLADVSERWRAALFLECKSVSYKNHSGNWGHKLAGTGRGYLCGIDDNGDEWGHYVDHVWGSADQFEDHVFDVTVEEAMAELFEINQSKLAACYRQGDLLFCPAKIRHEDQIVCQYCGYPKSRHISKKRHRYETDEQMYEYLECPDYPFDEYAETILPKITLHPSEKWEIRESHEVWSPGLERNGRYFRSQNEIIITHSSHATVILPPGEYRVYALQVADAD